MTMHAKRKYHALTQEIRTIKTFAKSTKSADKFITKNASCRMLKSL